jgi:hypothetical protein
MRTHQYTIEIRSLHRRQYLEHHRRGEGQVRWTDNVLRAPQPEALAKTPLVPLLDKVELQHDHLMEYQSARMSAVIPGRVLPRAL